MQIKYLILFTLTGFVVAIDQVTKLYIGTFIELDNTIPWIQDFLSLTYQKNTAGIFDIFQNVDPTMRKLFFILVPSLALVVIILAVLFSKKLSQRAAIGLALIAGGALGNLLDRVRFNYVIGFLDFNWLAPKHPLNLADLFLCMGGIILIFHITFSTYREGEGKT